MARTDDSVSQHFHINKYPEMEQAASYRSQDGGWGKLLVTGHRIEDEASGDGDSWDGRYLIVVWAVCHCPSAFVLNLHYEMASPQSFLRGGREPRKRRNRGCESMKTGHVLAVDTGPRIQGVG